MQASTVAVGGSALSSCSMTVAETTRGTPELVHPMDSSSPMRASPATALTCCATWPPSGETSEAAVTYALTSFSAESSSIEPCVITGGAGGAVGDGLAVLVDDGGGVCPFPVGDCDDP